MTDQSTDQSTDQQATQTAYARLGGSDPVRVVVQRFYERVLADPALAPYFEGVDMTIQRRHFALLVVQLLGGPSEYDGRELGEAHRGLHVTDDAFDKVVAHLVAALQEADVPADIIGAIGQTATDVRTTI